MNKPRYPQFKIGDLVKFKKRYTTQNFYGIIMEIGEDGSFELDERFVRVLWANLEDKIRDERIRTLDLISTS